MGKANYALLLLLLPVTLAKFNINPAILENHPAGNSINIYDYEDEDYYGIHRKAKDHEHSKPPDEIILDGGYPAETHTVTTEDGYILRMHRIPHARGESYNRSRPVVFLMHGLLSSAADWVVMGPGHGLGFILSDAGYDVWMGNYRGNTYSHDHLDDSISEKDYWSFSWDEMARYDLPTMLTHMMAVTGAEKFHYIGHSMGTLTYYTACNYHPWIANATRLMVGYGPHTIVPHMTSPVFSLLSKYVNNIHWLFDKLGIYEFLPSNWLVEWAAAEVCDTDMAEQALCREVMFLIAGYNKNEMNNTALPYILGHTPAGTSTQNMIHYAQSKNRGLWQGYDYGSAAENQLHWNSANPPKYSYDKITAPVALYWSQNDWLVVPEDAAYLNARLPNVVLFKRVNETAYTHLDFLWGIHNTELVYGPTLEIMAEY